MRILLIEDDARLAASVAKHLRAEHWLVDCAADGRRGGELACVNEYDVVVLDIMLPLQDGWTTCNAIRKAGVLTPILMLTALDDVLDKIRGLDCGADDYLPKPFHAGELLARLRALARRRTDVKQACVERCGLRLDLAAHRAWRGTRELPLTAKEFALLELLIMHAGKIVTRERIAEHLWDMNYEPRSNVIESFVRLLRQKVDTGTVRPVIHTIRGAGYMLTDERGETGR